MRLASSRPYAPWLWLLTGLFAVRVAAQPAALVLDDGPLPSFESWHGGLLPYPLLLSFQLVLLYWMAMTARSFGAGRAVPHPPRGLAMLVFGGLYFTVMLVRLVLGVTLFADVRWFASPIPAFFHLVLAAYAILYGRFHFQTRPVPA